MCIKHACKSCLRLSLAAAVAAALGCERDTPLVDAATVGQPDSAPSRTPAPAPSNGQAASNSKAPAFVVDTDGVKNMGRGTKPLRGIVQVLPPGALAVEFEPAQMDFGVLSPGEEVRGTSRIWNVGSEPLRIVKSITSCGCTSADDLAGRVIPPGGSTEFATTMHMKSGLGEKKEKITVYFAGDTERVAVQYYTAEVSLPVRLQPPHLAASRHDGNMWVHTLTGEITVSSIDGKPFRILASHGRPPEFVGFDPDHDEPRNRYTIRWDLGIFGDGVIPWFWVIETDRPDAPVVDARIQHSSTVPTRQPGRPWQPLDQRILVGEVYADVPFEISTAVEYGGGRAPDPSRAGVVSESPDMTARLLEVQVDGEFLRYRVEITPGFHVQPGLLYGTIAVSAGGFDSAVAIIGRVVE